MPTRTARIGRQQGKAANRKSELKFIQSLSQEEIEWAGAFILNNTVSGVREIMHNSDSSELEIELAFISLTALRDGDFKVLNAFLECLYGKL